MANRAFIRFRNITILNRAEVSNVYVRFTAYSDRSDTPVNLRCAFVDEDNPDAPVTFSELQSYNLTDWVSWSSLVSWTDGEVYDTPDLTDTLQGIIERIGWESGNSVMLIIEDVNSVGQRGFSSVRFSDGNEKALLFVTYLAREPSVVITDRGYIFGGRGVYDISFQDTDEYIPDTWTSKTDNIGLKGCSSFTIQGIGYIYSGGSENYKYESDTWTAIASPLVPGRNNTAASTISNKGYIYCGHGYGETRDTDEYTPNTWVARTDAPYPPRVNLAASTINDKGYIYGGVYGITRQYDCDEYTPDTWIEKTNIPYPNRQRHAASTISDKGYIYGGRGAISFIQDCDEYTPDTWTSKTDMLFPARRYLAASTISDKGYIYGGRGASGPLQDCDEYIPDSWVNKSDIPDPARYELAATTI